VAPLFVGLIFTAVAAAIQFGLMRLVNAAPAFGWNLAAYSLLGGIAAVLIYRNAALETRRTASTSAHPETPA
jgi:hypothetical protein